MSFEGKFTKKHILIPGLILAVAIVLTLILLHRHSSPVQVNSIIGSETGVSPIVYLETGIGSYNYHTKSYQIGSQNLTETEIYERSFSKIFPSRALQGEPWPEDEIALWEKYGQLMVYYDTADGPAYLFEQPQQYMIIYQDKQAVITFSGDRSLFDFNVFDGHFYIFCYDAMDESTGDFSEIVVYKYTMDLQPAGEFCMDLSALNVSCAQLATNSMAIKKDKCFFAIQDGLHFYTVAGDLASGELQKQLVRYQPICHVVSEDSIYAIGTKGDRFVLEERREDGLVIDITEVKYPNGTAPSFGLRREWIYGKDSTLYGCADDENGNPVLFSYDIEQAEWTNWWTVNVDSPYLFMDYKFVFEQDDGSTSDLLPYQFA